MALKPALLAAQNRPSAAPGTRHCTAGMGGTHQWQSIHVRASITYIVRDARIHEVRTTPVIQHGKTITVRIIIATSRYRRRNTGKLSRQFAEVELRRDRQSQRRLQRRVRWQFGAVLADAGRSPAMGRHVEGDRQRAAANLRRCQHPDPELCYCSGRHPKPRRPCAEPRGRTRHRRAERVMVNINSQAAICRASSLVSNRYSGAAMQLPRRQ